jgi:cystathionine beta-lyase/cystathionine gamma-synthase
MMSIETGSLENANAFAKGLRVGLLAESLGGVETLVCHPATMTHAGVSAEERARLGISDGLMRVSVGIEDVEDIVEDLGQALDEIG